jgi:hypothetical protein
METYSSWVNCPKEKCVYESTWRIKIKSLSLELSHVNTKIFVIFFVKACGKNRYCMQIKYLDLYKKDHENLGINMREF